MTPTISVAAPSSRLQPALPIVATVVFALLAAATITAAAAAGTLGYDFLAYQRAATRLVHGLPLYDMSYQAAGGFGLFFYPPTFAPLILPFGLMAEGPAVWAWTGILVAATVAAVAILPIAARERWAMLLLAGLSWPVAYSIKLGQVGPILLFLFAAGWRWLDNQRAVGATAALGAAIKIQPGLVLGWALLTRRWTALLAGAAVLVALALAGLALAGLEAWRDFLTLLVRVSDPITTPHNATPGAVLWQLGVPRDVAAGVQLASSGLALVIAAWAALRRSAVPSFLAAVVASQLISPILWDHYAVLLLLPAAYLLGTGRRWGVVIPLLTPMPLVGLIPLWIYPLLFWGALLALAWPRDGAAA